MIYLINLGYWSWWCISWVINVTIFEMKSAIGNQILQLSELQSIVIEKIRSLGFDNVSEESLINNEIHRALFIDAIERELVNINVLQEEYSNLLKSLK